MSSPATIYARYSSAEQGRGSSIKRQRELCTEFANQRGLYVESIIADEGRSAYAGTNRAEGSALFEFERKAKAGHFSNGHILICEHLDRISRQGWEEVYGFLKDMTAAGVTVATVDGSRIYAPAERVQMATVMEIILKAEVAWEESNKKSVRILKAWGARLEKVREGSSDAITKQTPAWMTVEGGKVVLIEHRAAVLREMYEWSAAGFGGPAIVKRLNDRNEPTWGPATKGWQLGYVTRLLTNRSAIGEYEPMKRARNVTLATSKGERFLHYYPAAIDVELFNRVQEGRSSRKGTGGKRGLTQSNLFSGLATCAHCGGKMTYGSTRKAGDTVNGTSGSRKPITYTTKTDHSFLQCDNAKRLVRKADGDLCDNHAKVRYEVLEPAILDQLMTVAFDDSSFAQADEMARLRVEIAEIERQVDEKSLRLSNLVDSFSRTGSPTIEAAILSLEAEICADQDRLRDLKNEHTRSMGASSPDEHIRRVREIRDAMTDANPEVRLEARVRIHQALKGIITRMTCDGQRFTTLWIADGLSFMQFNGKGEIVGEITLPARIHMQGAQLADVLDKVRGREGNGPRVDSILKRSLKGDAPVSVQVAANLTRD